MSGRQVFFNFDTKMNLPSVSRVKKIGATSVATNLGNTLIVRGSTTRPPRA